MQLNKLNNIIFLKDMESNIIEEAFIVLKENVKIHKIESDKENIKGNLNILKEAEVLVNKEIKDSDIKYEKFKIRKIEKKLKISKFINITLVLVLIIIKLLN